MHIAYAHHRAALRDPVREPGAPAVAAAHLVGDADRLHALVFQSLDVEHDIFVRIAVALRDEDRAACAHHLR